MDTRKRKTRRFPKEFRQVANYIKEQKGIDVVLGEDTDYRGPFTREIVIHHNYDLRNNGLYILLFECGKTFQSPIEDYNSKWDVRTWNMNMYYRDFTSWKTGWEIAQELNLDVNFIYYAQYRNDYLLKYFSDKLN